MKVNLKDVFKPESRYWALFLSLLFSAVGFGLYKGVIDNYMAEVVRMNELDRGVTEFFREVPGLLLVLILAIFYRSSAERMYKIGMVVMVAGMLLQTFVSPMKLLVILAVFIYIDRTFHGQGIGRMLYEALEERLKAQGITNMYACIAYTEQEDEYLTNASVRFHERMGFQLCGTFHRCAVKFGRSYDMVWMEKFLFD